MIKHAIVALLKNLSRVLTLRTIPSPRHLPGFSGIAAFHQVGREKQFDASLKRWRKLLVR